MENGDNYSIGAFYKDIDKPIEALLTEADGRFTLEFDNADTAFVYGIEAEWLLELSADALGGAIFTSGNVTLSDSEVEILEADKGDLTNLKRRMTGHSKYVANFQLNYDSHNGNHQASVIYNVFGDRILAAGVNDFDDAYLAPIYDVVTTTMYVKNDIPALRLSDCKLWWKEKTYKVFAKQSCGLSNSEYELILKECENAVLQTKKEISRFKVENKNVEKFLEDLMDSWSERII